MTLNSSAEMSRNTNGLLHPVVIHKPSHAVHVGEPREGLCFRGESCPHEIGTVLDSDLFTYSILLEGDTFIPWQELTFSLKG